MRQYMITEEQRDALAEVVAVIGDPKHANILAKDTQEHAREVVRCLRSLPELPAEETEDAIMDDMINELDNRNQSLPPFYIPASEPGTPIVISSEPETCEVRACSNCRHESARATDWPCDECSANSGWEPITIKPGRE